MMQSEKIKKIAEELGFDQVGITSFLGLKPGEKSLQDWVAQGKHGEMRYLEDFAERQRKFLADFSEPRSVIALGVNYFNPHPSRGSTSPIRQRTDPSNDLWRKGRSDISGQVAMYAWGKDYHEVIREKHELFIQKLLDVFGDEVQAKSCVDIQPVTERFAGAQAGLGFLGKNTLVLNQTFGPWLFLSEVITSLELEEDLPSEGDCGTCNTCQTICPTGALDEDYNIDARLCISYLTIEYKGVIPRELRPKMKNWLFGCDECLTFCPFSSKSKPGAWPEFQPTQGIGSEVKLQDLFHLKSNREYENYFMGTALLRAGRKQMLRNACIVLGNSRQKEAIPYLEQALKDPASLVRLHAAWALGEIRQNESKEILENHLKQESDPLVLSEIELSLKMADK